MVALLALLTGFVPVEGSREFQSLAGETSQAKGKLPSPLLPESFKGGVKAPSSLRAPVLEVRDGEISLRPLGGSLPVKLETTSSTLTSMLTALGKPQNSRSLVPAWGRRSGTGGADAFDFGEDPLRWNGTEQSVELAGGQGRTDKIFGELRDISGLTAALRRNAEQYRDIVEKYAERYNLTTELVFAIIHTESNFDPYLVSHRSAHGLMQVVPDTAGGEVHRWFGRTGKPSPSTLLQPETNIKYGTAYMHLLQTRHLSAITDPQSREYCAIAAYNSGAGRMLKTFGRSQAAAFEAINAMSPEQVRTTLLKKLSSRETRAFLTKVLESRERFSVMS